MDSDAIPERFKPLQEPGARVPTPYERSLLHKQMADFEGMTAIGHIAHPGMSNLAKQKLYKQRAMETVKPPSGRPELPTTPYADRLQKELDEKDYKEYGIMSPTVEARLAKEKRDEVKAKMRKKRAEEKAERSERIASGKSGYKKGDPRVLEEKKEVKLTPELRDMVDRAKNVVKRAAGGGGGGKSKRNFRFGK